MLQNSNLTIGTAVANQSGAMEADTISKNGRSSKSHTSRKNIFKMAVLFCVMFCVSLAVQGQGFQYLGKFGIPSKIGGKQVLLSAGHFNIEINLTETTVKNEVFDKVKISVVLKFEDDFKFYRFESIGMISNDEEILLSGEDGEKEVMCGLNIMPAGMIFTLQDDNDKTVQYLMDHTDIMSFDYNALLKAFKSKKSSR